MTKSLLLATILAAAALTACGKKEEPAPAPAPAAAPAPVSYTHLTLPTIYSV